MRGCLSGPVGEGGFSSNFLCVLFLCVLFLRKYVFSLVLQSFLSPPRARSHPRCQNLLPEGPNLHEVITKRANLPTLGVAGWGESRRRG